jgi:hypothetical protein
MELIFYLIFYSKLNFQSHPPLNLFIESRFSLYGKFIMQIPEVLINEEYFPILFLADAFTK